MKITHEVVDGLPVTRIGDDTYHYSFGYYATNNWLDEHRLVITRSPNLGTTPAVYVEGREAVLVDIENKTETVLGDIFPWIVQDGTLYATEKSGDETAILAINDTTCEVYRTKLTVDDLTITADGNYLVFGERETDDSRRSHGCRLDLATGEATVLFEKQFQKPFNVTNHYMVNPQDPKQVFFAHEGDTLYVSNRLWLYDEDRGMHCMAKQRLDGEGNLGDCFGHECWAPDGSGLWFVKYPCSPLPPRGLCFAGVNGEQTDVVYGAYPYWHVCCAPNGRYLAADTQGPGYSSVVVIDKETGKEAEAYRAGFLWSHPAHPHPTFSPSSEQVIFHDLKDGQLTLGIFRTTDALK